MRKAARQLDRCKLLAGALRLIVATRVHLASLLDDIRQLVEQTAVVEHRGVRRFPTSYAALEQGAQWFAAELVRRSIAPGERVVLWGENGAAWIACFFGCVHRGVLVVPLDASGTAAFAERIIAETSPRLIVGDELLLRSLSGAQPRLSLEYVSEALRNGSSDRVPAAELGPGTPLQILFTSGTTGEPKGVVHTHRNLLASLTPIEREIGKYRRYERWVHPLHFLHTLPLSHVFGQFMGLWVAPVLGAVVHYESRLEAGRLLRLFKRERISVLAAVPRVLALLRTELLATHPQLAAQLESAQGVPIGKRWWRFRRLHWQLGLRFWAIVCGGATLPEVLESFWTTLGVALIQGYGMTETSALVTLNHPFKPARGTLGAPLPGRELRISDAGELLVRGEMVATTTWKDGGLRQASGDGWLATGDLTRRDEQGRLEYLGRTGQRLVTSAGLNVYLEDVEAALAGQPGVDAAVAVVVEGTQGPEPGAVVRAADARLAAAAVERANAGLAAYQRIGRWWLWPGLDLPRTATGKVRRGVVEGWVRERLLEEANSAPAARGPGDPVLLLIEGVTGAAVSGGDDDGRPVESLGLDSLGRVQLQSALERASGRSIDDAAMASARTLGELRRLAGVEVAQQPVPAIANEASGGAEMNVTPEAAAAQPATPPAKTESFLYLRWPWAWPVQLVRAVFLEAIVRPLVRLLAAPQVERASDIDTSQPLLIVANHVSSYDAPLLLYGLPGPLRRRVAIATGGEMLEDWRHARGNPAGPAIFWLLTVLFNVFPLPRGHAFRRSFEHAGEAMDRGYSVLIFPEGTRSHGGPMKPFRGGIGLLAQSAGAQVLAVGLKQWRSEKPGRPYGARVRIGPLLTIRAGEEAHAITRRLEEAVRKLAQPGL
jgi:long-chain acyl-CoA synthetase